MNELKYRLRKVGGIGDDAADFIEQQAAEIAALQAKLSAMEKQEPAVFICHKPGTGYQTVARSTKSSDEYRAKGLSVVGYYTAPKVAQPLSEQALWDLFYESAQTHGFTTHAQYTSFARAIEKAHNIGGQQP